MKRSISDFVQSTITSMNPQDFGEFVLLFERHYFNSEAINVDGANDGGNDIRLYQNKREVKKCVQVTTNKSIDKKLKLDLQKVYKLITDFQYSYNFDFFCSCHISEEKIEEYKKLALDNYDINLNILDSHRLAQLDCKPALEFIYSLHKDVNVSIKPLPISRANKVLYDVLVGGRNSLDIKNGFLHSVIISVLYELGPLSIEDLCSEVEKRLGSSISSIQSDINLLISQNRITRSKGNILSLSQEECDCMRAIVIASNRQEQNFMASLNTIVNRYKIENASTFFIELQKIFTTAYQNDIEEIEGVRKSYVEINDLLTDYLKSVMPDKNSISAVCVELRQLCEENSYLNRITASSSFLSLYKSNRLDDYITHKKKLLYLDTPAFIYYLCAKFEDTANWDNPYFKSMQSLIRLQDENPKSVEFRIMENYLREVAGEIRKGLQCSWIENTCIADSLGETKNTFYNFYRYLRHSELFEIAEDVNCFEDFVSLMGFDNLDTESPYFINETIRILGDIAEDFGIRVVSSESYKEFSSAKICYEKLLGMSDNIKTQSAIKCDVSQTLFLLDRNNCVLDEFGYPSDTYFVTWDVSFFQFRKKLIEDDSKRKYEYFYIANPAQLSNRLALENFKIDSSCISSDIFLYAEQRYDISNKVKTLIDIIAPIIAKKDGSNMKLVGQLARIRKNELQELYGENSIRQRKTLPIEDALIAIVNYANRYNNENLFQRLSIYMNKEVNTKEIIDDITIISQALQKREEPNIDVFFEKVKSINIIQHLR